MKIKERYSWFDGDDLQVGDEKPKDKPYSVAYTLTADDGKTLVLDGVPFGKSADTDNLTGWGEENE